MIVLLALAGQALAACQLMQTATETGTIVVIQAMSEPLSCRRVTISAPDAPPAVKVRLDGRRVRRDHVRVEGNRIEIGLPELRVGGEARIDVAVAGDKLEVVLGEPPPPAAPAETHVTLAVALNPKHPGWGFADPAFATSTRTTATVGPDGLTRTEVGGAPAQGVERLAPGSFTLDIPGARFAAWASPGVTLSYSLTGARWDAPQGGEARWRVSSAVGEAVIPDGETFRAGLDWRFVQVSFPEPAIPTSLVNVREPQAITEALYAAARALTPGWLPGSEPLRPRPLNRAWRSGWASSVERGLILQRLLEQARVQASWLLTGEEAEVVTLTGYDTMLVAARLPDRDVLLDPGCPVCAFDEVSTRVAGKPAVGAAPLVPLSEGHLGRVLTLSGSEYRAEVTATGAAALFLREAAYGLGEARRAEVIADSVGMPGGRIEQLVGLDEPGASMTLTVTSKRPPVAPFETDPPWLGGWTDQ